MDTQVITILSALALAMPVALGQDANKPAPKKGGVAGFVEQSSKNLRRRQTLAQEEMLVLAILQILSNLSTYPSQLPLNTYIILYHNKL